MWWFSILVLLYNSSFIFSQSLPLLLLVSFNGFRWDYPKLYGPLGNFSRLEQRGVHAHSMIPTFTTATYPNHYTLITGLYEEIHGLISDHMYDPKTNQTFQAGETTTNQWWPFKTIWTLNEQMNGARSGVINWPQGFISTSKYEPYKKDRSFKDTIDLMLSWFNDQDRPINFGAMYFPEPDLTGRQTGPYSRNMKETIKQCDEYLGYLLNEIDKDIRLKTKLHLIITSDHGMEQINATDKPMYLEDFVNINKLKAFGTETVLNIFVNQPNDINSILQNLTQIPHSNTYKKENLPDRYHYKTNSRIGDLIIIVEPGYELHRRSFRICEDGGTRVDLNTIHGNSGYDNQIDSMKTIFYASGPELKENFTLSKSINLNNVDIFPLMCLILNIEKCSLSNGTLSHIQPFLNDPSKLSSLNGKETEKLHDGPMGLVIYLLVLVSFVLILIMAVAWSAVSFRNASAMARAAHPDAATIAEQNQYKFTQINDLKLHPSIGDDNL
ncbi:unnamed protein product [Adineta steineri]|uniref:Uncharacterized protein n=1 Tax=Adineta steineri TaxID=433720 RepID=A0A815IUV2_9BILA|nr:unnamed protein product [Adineta steineri]CAF3734690.1 unnamed protein product [Adineta steineri]